VAHDPYALSDEDRLPWLEPVDDYEEQRGGGRRWLAPLLAALVLLGLGIVGLWWWQNREVAPTGSGELIAAPEGPYKVKPEEEGGMAIEGQGETAFATSEGAEVKGALDMNAVPEAPVERAPAPRPSPQATPKAGASSIILENQGGVLTARAVPTQPEAEGAPGATIQLGAFPTQDSAKKSWESMQKRFAYLAERSPSILKAEVNGRTFHRLRVGAGSAAEARDLCARLRVAGESCLVVN
jgi:hypothetical protein